MNNQNITVMKINRNYRFVLTVLDNEKISAGEIRIDGIPVKSYRLHELHTRIGMVLQKNELFTGTILENLRWGKPDATQEEAEEACRAAPAHGFHIQVLCSILIKRDKDAVLAAFAADCHQTVAPNAPHGEDIAFKHILMGGAQRNVVHFHPAALDCLRRNGAGGVHHGCQYGSERSLYFFHSCPPFGHKVSIIALR